jgi:PhnB protein
MGVNTYLNFEGQTEEAFNFYAKVFDVSVGSMMKMDDSPSGPELSEVEKSHIMHASLTLPGGMS